MTDDPICPACDQPVDHHDSHAVYGPEASQYDADAGEYHPDCCPRPGCGAARG